MVGGASPVRVLTGSSPPPLPAGVKTRPPRTSGGSPRRLTGTVSPGRGRSRDTAAPASSWAQDTSGTGAERSTYSHHACISIYHLMPRLHLQFLQDFISIWVEYPFYRKAIIGSKKNRKCKRGVKACSHRAKMFLSIINTNDGSNGSGFMAASPIYLTRLCV